MAELLYRLGLAAARRTRLVVAAWLVVLLVAGGAFAAFGGTLTNSFTIPGTPTQEVTDRLEAELPQAAGGTGTVVLTTTDDEPFTAEQRAEVADRLAQAAEVDGVEAVVDPFVTEEERTAQAQQVEAGLAEVEAGRAQLEQGRAQLEEGRAQLDAARVQLEAGRAQLDAARAQAEAAGMLDAAAPQLEAQEQALAQGEAELEARTAELEAAEAELTAGAAELDAGAEQLADARTLLDAASGVRTVSEDGSTALATVVFTEASFDIDETTREAVLDAFAAPIDGVTVDFSADLTTGVPEVFGVAEALGLVVAAVVLVVMLGTLVGAGLPILTALIGVGIGALAALSLSGVVQMASMTPVLGIMLGLAVGIDYTLFIVNRHRRQLKHGYTVTESIGLANGTSGNAVVFAGATVLIALLALNVTGIPFLGLMGTVAALCIAVAVALAVTLTPALLSLAGERILSRRERAELARTSGATVDPAAPLPGVPTRPMSTPRAVLRVVGGVALLGLLAVPAADLRLALPDGSSEATDSTQYRAYQTVTREFGAGANGPLVVMADLPQAPSEDDLVGVQADVAEQLLAVEDVVAVVPAATSEERDVLVLQVVPTDGPTSRSTEELVHTLRGLSPLDGGIELGVAGQATGNIDVSERLADALPAYLGVVVGLSLIILVLVFRSVLVPLIATAGFILSFFAAMGGVVAVYQWGWLGGLVGVDNPGPVLSFLPTLLVGILFGLAMDYMLFLGSGMREAYAHGVPARVAVVQGVHAARSVVTAAAIIMVSVFGGFVFSHSTMIRPIGFGLALGVLVDAFVVRMLVVPGFLHLVGERAWWLPRWLDRLLPDVDVEGAKLERRHPHHVPEEESTVLTR